MVCFADVLYQVLTSKKVDDIFSNLFRIMR